MVMARNDLRYRSIQGNRTFVLFRGSEAGLGKKIPVACRSQKVGHRHARYFRESLLREKRLMRCDEDIGKGEQAREFVIVQNLARPIPEEHPFLLLIDIERNAAE